MKTALRIWVHSINFQIPTPVAAVAVVLVFLGTMVFLMQDWSMAGLPAPGAAGRHDWATQKYYKQHRLRLDAQESRWFREHPQYEKYRGLPPEELARRIQRDEDKQRARPGE